MTVGAICNRRIPTAPKTTSVVAAAKSMSAFDERVLIVTDEQDGKPYAVGIVTEREFIANVIAREADPAALTLRQIMRVATGFVRDTDSVFDAACWMHRNRVKEATVHDATGALIGVVTIDQLFQNIAVEIVDAMAPAANELVAHGSAAFH